MSLRVWLPLDGDLHNQGVSSANTIVSTGSSINTAGKIGQCMKITSTTDLQYTPDFNHYGLSLSGWFKVNQAEIAAVVDTLSYTSTASTPTGNLLGNTSYGGIGLIWTGNNHYSSGTFSSITAYATLRTASVNQTTAGATIEFDTWIHLTLTWNPNTHILSLYKNGNLIGSKTFTAFTDGISRTLYLNYKAVYGGNGPSANIPLYCNDVRIYDHCLSVTEVKEIAQGLILHYKLDMPQLNNSTTLTSEISNTAYNSSLGKYGYNNDSNLAKTTGTFQGKNCVKISTITAGQNAQPYVYFSNLFTSNGTNQPAYKKLTFEYYTTCPTTTWLNIYKLGSGTGTVSWKTINSKGIHNGIYTNSESGHNLLVEPNEWNYVEVILNGDTDANAEWGYCINGPTHTSNANYYFLYANIKLEASNQLKIQDNSGYNHNGIGIGNLKNTSDTKRYDSSIKWNSSDPTTNSNTGLCYIQTPLSLATPLQLSFTWWGKPESGYGDNTGHAVFCTSNSDTAPTDYNTTAFHHRDSGFDIYPSDGSGAKRLSFSYTKNEWHHYAVTYDGTTARTYQDGVLKTSIEVGANKTLASFSQLYIGFSKAGGVWRKTLGSYSDFRVYVTQLLDTDIKQLYNVGMKVDKGHNIHVYEFQEQNINLFSSIPWTASYGTHSTTTNLFTNYNSKNELQFVANSTSAGSNFIEITPGIYEYDYTISVNAGNQFYIGFERYDANKTSRSNAACVYTYATKPSSDVVKQRYKGTVDLSTDGVNTIKYIALRILNGWSGTTSGVTGQATIHNFSLRLQSAAINPEITKTGQLIGDEFKEYSNAKFYKDHIIEANEFIER